MVVIEVEEEDRCYTGSVGGEVEMLEEQDQSVQEGLVTTTNLEEATLTIEAVTTKVDVGATIEVATVESVSTEGALEE